jgi:predicted transposase YdaD
MSFDNVCKYLAEEYPETFARWLLQREVNFVEVLKTELTIEPIRADSVIFLRLEDRILHIEFQVKVPLTGKPMPTRALNYWTRLHWQYGLPVTQVIIWLKETSNPAVYENEFRLELTIHGFNVIRLWEESPDSLLQYPELLPLAVLAGNKSNALLERVAQKAFEIEDITTRNNISASISILAGLRFERELISSLFREEIMQESVIYQDILQRGEKRESVRMIMRPIKRRFGTIEPQLESQISSLSVAKLEDLNEVLLDITSLAELQNWLDSNS